jgi:hypothetical protein
MKNNKLRGIIVVAAITLLQLNSALAQSSSDSQPTRISIALGLGAPTKSYMGDIVIAPDLRLQHNLGQNMALTLTAGYYSFVGMDELNGIKSFSDQIPLKAGVKFFFGETFYFLPEAGIVFGIEKDYGNSFTYAPNFGYATEKWDFSLRYEGFETYNSSTGMVAARLAYAFKIGK